MWHAGLVATQRLGSQFLNQGSNLRPLHCKADSLPLDHQGIPRFINFYRHYHPLIEHYLASRPSWQSCSRCFFLHSFFDHHNIDTCYYLCVSFIAFCTCPRRYLSKKALLLCVDPTFTSLPLKQLLLSYTHTHTHARARVHTQTCHFIFTFLTIKNIRQKIYENCITCPILLSRGRL